MASGSVSMDRPGTRRRGSSSTATFPAGIEGKRERERRLIRLIMFSKHKHLMSSTTLVAVETSYYIMSRYTCSR